MLKKTFFIREKITSGKEYLGITLLIKLSVLALHYFDEYSRLGGGKSYEEVRKDFLIVAVASIHVLDAIARVSGVSMAGQSLHRSCHSCCDACTTSVQALFSTACAQVSAASPISRIRSIRFLSPS
jgi:hypothetical protein